MATALNDVPTFKLAKVGKERDRRRGGGAWWSGARGAGSGLGGLGGGGSLSEGLAGLFSAGGMSLGKALTLFALCGAMGAGAWQFGRMFSPSVPNVSHPKLFADRGTAGYSNLSDVVAGSNSIPNSIGYVSGSLDGMTPAERAKKAAEEAAARKAAEDAAKKKAAEDAAAQAAADKAAADKAPADVAAGAAAGSGSGASANPFGAHFGQLSSGLSGGGGLSGGIGQSFGGGAFGGGLPGAKGNAGNLTAMSGNAKPSLSHSTPRAMQASRGSGFAMGQLRQTQAASHAAAGTTGETASSTAGMPFDGGMSGGTSIDGPGTGYGSTGGSGIASSPNNPAGGPMGGGMGGCGAGQGMDANGNCTNVGTPSSANATPYQGLMDVAKALLALLAILSVIFYFMSKSGVLSFWAGVIGLAMMAIGAMLAGIGMAILASSGDKMIGGIITVVGLFAVGSPWLLPGTTTGIVVFAAGSLIGSAGALLAASSASANQLGSM